MAVSSRLAGILVVTALLGASCDSGRRDPGPDLLDEVDVQPAVTVEVSDDGFDPTTLSVEAGEAFEVVNKGDDPHSFVIDDPIIDTGPLFPGESSVIVLTTPGTVQAHDAERPEATLDIEVTPAS
ncbi:MAG TPA: cupredoxin domain-containing protein [Acidimicrobiales bacterium]|nr:cupredoxin domain-containing protein [Acidimicrobiales bacterium]